MTYTLKQLAKFIEPGQFGLNQERTHFLFRPYNANDPRVKYLVENTNWRPVRPSREYVLQAIATLENYYFLAETGLAFMPTERVQNWYHATVEASYDWTRDSQNSVLFDYQKEAVHFLSFKDRAMLSLSPGLGKTLTSAYAAGLRGFDNVLAVVPASLLYYWKGELEKWADKLPRRPQINILHRNKTYTFVKQPVQDSDQYWVITNPETAIKRANEIVNAAFNCLIADESIMYKHRDSNRSETMKALAQNFKTVWFLTGAPATRNLDDMWHQFHILKPQGYPSYWRFARKYCLVLDDEWGSKVIGNQPGGEEAIKKNFKDIYFSRTQDDVADIPDWIMEDIDIPMYPAQDNAYNTLREEFYVRLESLDPNAIITVDNHLSLMIRSVQVASNPVLLGGVDSGAKWDAVPALMETYPGPYIVWVNFIDTGFRMRDMLSAKGMQVALANGATKIEDRNQMVDALQGGKLDAIILNNQVGKFGFTLTKARTAFFVERMYDDSYFQCLHRNRRIGTTQSPLIINMRSVTQEGETTIDHLIHDTLDYRVGMIKKVTAADLKKVFAKKK